MTTATVEESIGIVETRKMYIDGKWIDSSSGNYFDVIDPSNGQVYAKVPRGNNEDVNRAVASAKSAFEFSAWRNMEGAARRNLLLSLGKQIEKNAERLALTETRSNGKLFRETVPQTRSFSEFFYYFAGWADKLTGETVPLSDTNDIFCYTLREPIGVVAAITPWNAPLLLTIMKMAPALAVGDTFVLKPSRYTPVTAIALAECVEAAGFPPGVFNVVTGTGAEIGNALARHPDVNKVSFTGSTEVGKEVLRNASENIAKVTLELGGKSPDIVFEDADIDNAVNGVLGGIFAFNGQICVAGSRILLQSEIVDEFVEKMVKRAQTIKLGDPMSAESEMGPISNKEQLAKIEQYVELGRKEGGKIVCGGKRPDDPKLSRGLYYTPTIIRVENKMRIAQEEIFGPVAGVIEFNDEDEAVRIANSIRYGLAAGIWTRDVRRAHRVARKLRAGTVWINTYGLLPSAAAPMGGYKQSGIGRENGFDVVREYSLVKSVWVNLHEKIGDLFKPA